MVTYLSVFFRLLCDLILYGLQNMLGDQFYFNLITTP